jgi:hypothetical protein
MLAIRPASATDLRFSGRRDLTINNSGYAGCLKPRQESQQ